MASALYVRAYAARVCMTYATLRGAVLMLNMLGSWTPHCSCDDGPWNIHPQNRNTTRQTIFVRSGIRCRTPDRTPTVVRNRTAGSRWKYPFRKWVRFLHYLGVAAPEFPEILVFVQISACLYECWFSWWSALRCCRTQLLAPGCSCSCRPAIPLIMCLLCWR